MTEDLMSSLRDSIRFLSPYPALAYGATTTASPWDASCHGLWSSPCLCVSVVNMGPRGRMNRR